MRFQLIRSDRKSLSLSITREGTLLVRAPRHMAKSEIEHFIASKSDWIEKHMDKRKKDLAGCKEAGSFTEAEKRRMVELSKAILPQKVAYYARIIGVTYGRITIRSQKSRWGSCTSQGNLNFNCLLMMTPEAVMDYVVVHELCHRLEMNHSSKFWKHVENVLPDYKIRRKWLKENEGQLLARMFNPSAV